MADIFDGYRLANAWDEMFAAPGRPRAPYDGLVSVLQPMDPGELRFRADQLARVFTDRGVTYDYAGEERPFPLDLIPRVIDAAEWDLIARGVRQRVRALEAFLADAYGPGRAFEDGVVPWRLLYTTPSFRREVAGLVPSNGVRVHVAGIDLVRDEEGQLRVLEDNVRVPSGVSYVIENRLAMSRIFPALFAEQSVHDVDEYPSRLLAALRKSAPRGATDPFVVVLTPGVHNAAYFEHTLLARLMGVELVEGRDLVCSRNRVYVHTTHGRRAVDVIYRRVAPTWAELSERAVKGRLLEFLMPTPLTTIEPSAAQPLLGELRGADPLETAGHIAAKVRERVRYMAGSTGVRTNAQQAWDQGQGVCQDIAHVTVGLLRTAGMPARYVSGYLHADPAAEPGHATAGQSHAWVEYWAGAWVAWDPTNGAPAGERHVVVARGRDYADVPPLKGIYHGPPDSALDVTVEVTRLA